MVRVHFFNTLWKVGVSQDSIALAIESCNSRGASAIESNLNLSIPLQLRWLVFLWEY
jgi:hypothetical protein